MSTIRRSDQLFCVDQIKWISALETISLVAMAFLYRTVLQRTLSVIL